MAIETYSNKLSVVFDCYETLDVSRRMHLSRSNSKLMTPHLKKLIRNLSIQAMPFIAVGGSSSIFSREASTTTAANIMDALLDGLVGVSNRELSWPELSEYCMTEGTPLEPYEAVLDWLPGEVINETFDYVRFAIERLDREIILPLTLGKRCTVVDICMLNPKTMSVKATLVMSVQPKIYL